MLFTIDCFPMGKRRRKRRKPAVAADESEIGIHTDDDARGKRRESCTDCKCSSVWTKPAFSIWLAVEVS